MRTHAHARAHTRTAFPRRTHRLRPHRSSLRRAVLGSAIIYIFPALLYLATSKQREAAGTHTAGALVRAERWACRGMAALGVLLGVLGGAVSIKSAFF